MRSVSTSAIHLLIEKRCETSKNHSHITEMVATHLGREGCPHAHRVLASLLNSPGPDFTSIADCRRNRKRNATPLNAGPPSATGVQHLANTESMYGEHTRYIIHLFGQSVAGYAVFFCMSRTTIESFSLECLFF